MDTSEKEVKEPFEAAVLEGREIFNDVQLAKSGRYRQLKAFLSKTLSKDDFFTAMAAIQSGLADASEAGYERGFDKGFDKGLDKGLVHGGTTNLSIYNMSKNNSDNQHCTIGDGNAVNSNHGHQQGVALGTQASHVIPAPIAVAGAPRRNNPWVSGSFYLFAATLVLMLLLTASAIVPWYVLPPVMIGGTIIVSVVGALQLKNDDKIDEKSFFKLMALSFRYLPLVRSREKEATKKIPPKRTAKKLDTPAAKTRKLAAAKKPTQKKPAAKESLDDSSSATEPTED